MVTGMMVFDDVEQAAKGHAWVECWMVRDILQ